MVFHNLHRLPNIGRVNKSRRLILADHSARVEEGRSALNTSAEKSTGKTLLGRRKRRWEDSRY